MLFPTSRDAFGLRPVGTFPLPSGDEQDRSEEEPEMENVKCQMEKKNTHRERSGCQSIGPRATRGSPYIAHIHPSAAFRLPGPGPALPGRCSDGSSPLPPRLFPGLGISSMSKLSLGLLVCSLACVGSPWGSVITRLAPLADSLLIWCVAGLRVKMRNSLCGWEVTLTHWLVYVVGADEDSLF